MALKSQSIFILYENTVLNVVDIIINFYSLYLKEKKYLLIFLLSVPFSRTRFSANLNIQVGFLDQITHTI